MSPPETELARWQGRTDVRIEDAERRLDALNASLERLWKEITKLDHTVAGLVVKVAVGAVIGGLLGSVVSMVLVYSITHR